MHSVAGRTTELRRLHVFNGTVGDLGADKDVRQRGDTEKPCQSLQGSSTIEHWLNQSSADTLPAYIHPNWDERQACKKNHRENEEDDDTDVRIIDVASNLQRQHKQPRNTCGRDQKYARQAHPILS